MELINNFANLAKNLSAKFPDLDEFYLYIHILGYVSGFDQPCFFPQSHDSIIVANCTFDEDTLMKIKDFFPIDQFSETEKKDLCRYFLEICLKFERKIENAPDKFENFAGKLLSSNESQVKSKDLSDIHFSSSSTSFTWSELSAKSQKEYLEWEIERYFYYKTPRIPKRINEKIIAFAEPKNRQTVYDPNCGDGSLFVEFYTKFPGAEFNFNGIVGNQFEWLFCLVNFYVNGILDDKRIEFDIEVSSPLENTPQWYYEMRGGEDYSLREKIADIAVSFVPSKSQLTDGERDSRFFALSHSLEQPEYAYIELMLNAVRDTGKVIAIVPDSVLSSSEGRFFRGELLSRDWIESVISLPENSFSQTDLSTVSIVVFNKSKSEKGIVVFDGEGSEFERTEIKNGAILSENDIDLRAARYALKEIKSIRNIIERHQERNSENLFVSSTENVALNQYFDNLAELFSEKFPTTKNTVYLYLLVVVVRILDWSSVTSHLHGTSTIINSKIYRQIEKFIFAEYYNKIISLVFDELKNNKLWFEIKVEDIILNKYGTLESNTPFKGRFNELCKYLISKCLGIKDSVQLINREKLIIELAKREPKAVKINSDGSFKSMELLKLSNIAFQEYSEAVIAQSFYFEKNFLQCFTALDETLAKIVDPKPKQEIFIPNCGIGSTFVALQKRLPNDDLWFTGNVDDSIFHLLCVANLLANSIRGSLIYELDFLDIDWSIPDDDEKYDIAIGIVPLNLVITSKINKKFFKLSHKRKNLEYSFIELLINSLNETGKAIVVVPEKFLYAGHAKGFKKEYLENDWVESVISLSEDAFGEYGSIKASIIVFNKNKAEKGFITFKSLDSRFEETRVSLDEILLSGSLDLRVNRYASKEVKELQSILSKYPQDEVKKIEDLVVSAISGFNYSPNNRILENPSETLPYVRVKDLSSNDKDFTLDISKVERKISPEKVTHKRTIIDFSAVLVSKIAPKLKPTYFNFTGQKIVIGSDVVALKVKEDVNVEYFLTQLYSQLVKIQVEMMSSGNTINRISTQDFLNIQIILPPLEEQSKQVIEFLKKTQKELIEDVAEVEKEVKNTEYDVIRIAIHDFNQKLGAMQNDLSDLKNFFEEKLSNYLNEPIKSVFDDDTEEEINQFRLGNVLQRLINTRNEASAQLAATREELQNNTVKPVYIKNLKRWFEEEVKPLYQNVVKFEVNGEKVEVEIDPNRFKTLIRNLIENAKRYNAKIVAVDISYINLDGENKVRILYKNNGKPFSEDFDFDIHFKGLYQKSAESEGRGIGGYSVNKTVELHNGEIKDVSPEKNSLDLFPVQLEIILPIEYKPNPNYVKSNPYSLN